MRFDVPDSWHLQWSHPQQSPDGKHLQICSQEPDLTAGGTVVYVTAVHLNNGKGHEHIAEYLWLNPADGKSGKTSTASMVEYIEQKKGDVKVAGTNGPASVGVVRENGHAPYLRTFADKQWSNNLLGLPRY